MSTPSAKSLVLGTTTFLTAQPQLEFLILDIRLRIMLGQLHGYPRTQKEVVVVPSSSVVLTAEVAFGPLAEILSLSRSIPPVSLSVDVVTNPSRCIYTTCRAV